jgi:glycosyltransferase involved in cell wall biosynthesis
MGVKLALSTLCENPGRRTGLSTFFPEFVAHARRQHPAISWLVFAGRDAPWPGDDPGVEVCRAFPSNERPFRRLVADHLRVASAARRRGAAALVTVGFLPLRRAGLPVVMQVFAVGDARVDGWARRAYRRWALARGFRGAALVIANSAWTRSRIPPALAPVIVSPEGLDHGRFRAEGPRGAEGLPPRYLLWASNLYPYKRAELALAAYAGLAPERRRQFAFVVAGGDWAGGRARAEAAARRLGVAGQVHFLGWVDDALLPALYRGAQAYVLSTAQESFGRGVLEAMACGCPGVLQDLPVLREVAGESALYADFCRPEGATAALERVCADEALRTGLAAEGIERARGFSFERQARERVGAILEAIGEAAP